jgi:hypothetical protein
VALGGTSYAAIKLPKNSVGSKQIKNNAVTASKIKKNSVTSAKVKNGSLLGADFKAGQLPAGPKGNTGATGARGADGAAGATGARGADGAALGFAKVSAAGTLNAAQSRNVTQANIAHPESGLYCFSGLPFTPRNVVGNIEFNGGGGTPGPYVLVEIGDSPGSGCPVGTQVTIGTLNNNDLGDRTFYVLFN